MACKFQFWWLDCIVESLFLFCEPCSLYSFVFVFLGGKGRISEDLTEKKYRSALKSFLGSVKGFDGLAADRSFGVQVGAVIPVKGLSLCGRICCAAGCCVTRGIAAFS